MADAGTVPTTFGAELRRQRMAAGLSRGALAERARLSPSVIGDLEREGASLPRPETLRLLAGALGLAPETLWGAGLADDFPAHRRPGRPPNNLPVQATPFVGREQQVDALCVPLRRGEVRLQTLTGPGGVGKTRLALQVAGALLDDFADGVFLVSLAPLADAELVPSAIAQALGLTETGGRSLLPSLQDFLREKHLLLVLDNCEHVLGAVPAVAALLGAASGVSAIVTSRAVLRLYGEHVFPVPPLALPDHRAEGSAAHVARFEAARLFVTRARSARPDFALTDENAALVAGLCRRLDGLPLALELAAARLRALPLPTLHDRLDHCLPLLTGGARDLPARQRTLRDTVAWSYDLLDADEQALFRRLSVFRGCTLEAAEAVCVSLAARPRSSSVALPRLTIDVLEGVTSLVEHSLLRQEETEDGRPWYVLLETIGEFAAERLAESGEAPAVWRRQILYCLRVAEAAEPELSSPQQKEWFARLEREHGNARVALDRCCELGYAEPAYRLVVALWWFWSVHGHVREGRERSCGVLTRFPPPAPTSPRAQLRARALQGAATLTCMQSDFAASTRLEEEALSIYRALGKPAEVVASLQRSGAVATVQGDYEAAKRVLNEALATARTLGDAHLTAISLHGLANALHEQGDFRAAGRTADEAVALFLELGNARRLAIASLTRAIVAQDEGDYSTARRLMEQSLATWEELHDARAMALAMASLGSLDVVEGDYAAAHERLAASLDIQQDLADTTGAAAVLDRFAGLAAAQGGHERALRLAGAAAALRTAAGTPASLAGQEKLDRTLAPARRALSDAAADRAWRSGQALSLAEAAAAAYRVVEAPLAPAGLNEGATGNRQRRAPAAALTAREQEVATLITDGLTNRRIGEVLRITEGTAASHVVHILDKLGFSTRAQIAAWVATHGLSGGP